MSESSKDEMGVNEMVYAGGLFKIFGEEQTNKR
jgi:hypothetical protein